MAQPIHCDGPGDQHPADVLLSMLANGETMAWCHPHYVDAARMLVEMVDAEAATAEAAATDADAIARLEAVDAPPTPDGSTELDAQTGEPLPDAFADPVRVVPKGRSSSRAAHEARQRARDAAVAPEPTPEPEAAPEPSSEGTGAPEPDAVKA